MRIFSDIEEYKEAFLEHRRPGWVFASAALTLDGRITSGRRPLGGDTDKMWHKFLVDQAEAIVLGGKTMREQSTPGIYKNKKIVVLSQSLEFNPEHFGEESYTIYTTSSQRPQWGPRVRIRPFLSPRETIRDLGTRRILVDGGGSDYTLFAREIDDWFLTLVPRFSGGTPLWTLEEDGPELRPAWLLSADDRIFGRWSRV